MYHLWLISNLPHYRSYCSKVDNHEGLLGNIRKCLEQKRFKQYTTNVDITKLKSHVLRNYFNDTTMYLQLVFVAASGKRNVFEETLIFDDIGLLGSLGGALGLFVGFSFFGFITPILGALFDRAADFLQQDRN